MVCAYYMTGFPPTPRCCIMECPRRVLRIMSNGVNPCWALIRWLINISCSVKKKVRQKSVKSHLTFHWLLVDWGPFFLTETWLKSHKKSRKVQGKVKQCWWKSSNLDDLSWLFINWEVKFQSKKVDIKVIKSHAKSMKCLTLLWLSLT